MKVKLICSLRFADFTGKPFPAGPFQLIRGGSKLDSDIFNEYVVGQIGSINIKEFINLPFWVTFLDIDDEPLQPIFTKAFSHLNILSSYIWLAKDNSIDLGYMYVYEDRNNGKILSQTKTSNVSFANGEFKPTVITIEDLNLAEKAVIKIAEVQNQSTSGKTAPNKEVNFERPTITDNGYHYRNYNEHNRIQRALSFLTMARSNSFLPLKISLYIAILETLFTTDSTEVNYKVCQRTAFYLEDNYEPRYSVFLEVKEAYDIRSKFFHGQELGKKKDSREYLATISVRTDEIIRKVLTKVLFTDSDLFLQKTDELNKYFNQLIFKY